MDNFSPLPQPTSPVVSNPPPQNPPPVVGQFSVASSQNPYVSPNTSSTYNQLQSSQFYHLEQLVNLQKNMMVELAALQQKNNQLLGMVAESSAYVAKITKRRYRLELFSFWQKIILYIIVGIGTYIGLVLSYQFVNQLMSRLPDFDKLNQGLSAVESMNGSMGNLNLESLLGTSIETNTDASQAEKIYPKSTTEPAQKFTTPAFLESFKNMDLSNIKGEDVLERLKITPYKTKEVDLTE